MNITELLEEFMLVPSPAGYEHEMAARLTGYFEKYCAGVTKDRLGNVIGTIEGRDPSLPTMMVFGHMDSIGMVVRKVEKNGYLRCDRLGGIPEKVLPGTEFLVRTEDRDWIPAVMGPKSYHIMSQEERNSVDKIATLALDLGAQSDEEVFSLGVQVGCPVVYKPRFNRLRNGLVSGTFIDNRGACACLVRLAELLHDAQPACTVYIVGTVQEEFNLRGAMMAARTVCPDIAVGLDVTLAGDTMDLNGYFSNRVGGGPGLQFFTFHSRGTLNGNLAHEPLARRLRETAAANGIPLQRTTGVGMLTDGSYIQLEGMGVATVDMGFATRYTHTPVETCDPADIEGLAQLLMHTAAGMDASFPLGRLD